MSLNTVLLSGAFPLESVCGLMTTTGLILESSVTMDGAMQGPNGKQVLFLFVPNEECIWYFLIGSVIFLGMRKTLNAIPFLSFRMSCFCDQYL